MSANDEQYEYVSETEEEEQQNDQPQEAEAKGPHTKQRARQNRQRNQQQSQQLPSQTDAPNGQVVPSQTQNQQVADNRGGNVGAIRQSRIKDRPVSKEAQKSALKIKIELDLEVEVDLYARVKGDVIIGLM